MPEQYRIEIKRSAAKEIRAIGRKKGRQRIMDRVGALAEAPRPPGCTKPSGQDASRVRQGAYRIVYPVAGGVLVVEVGNRRDVSR